uniref:Uncharacterized protein n=1 Tax=Sipha flava TaxID=143950 RepID=A0A2S2Q851_9HEMI
MHDNIPNDWPSEDNANDNMGENNPLNCKRTTNRGRQARSGLIEDHFANLQIILRRNNYMRCYLGTRTGWLMWPVTDARSCYHRPCYPTQVMEGPPGGRR